MKIFNARKLLFPILLLLAASGQAEPTGSPDKIIFIRPYLNTVFVGVATTNFCGTSEFKIDLTAPGGSALYSAALAAATAGKNVKLEALSTTGCAGWATQLLSIVVLM